jgi:hypothetical protein
MKQTNQAQYQSQTQFESARSSTMQPALQQTQSSFKQPLNSIQQNNSSQVPQIKQ